MNRFLAGGMVIVMITDRENREPVRTLLQQLGRTGYQVHVLSRVTYEQTGRIAPPQVVLIDVAYRNYQGAGNMTTNVRATWEYVPIVLVARLDELDRVPFSREVHGFLTLPVTLPELEARVRFAQWKTQDALPSRDVLEVDELRLNLATYEASVAGESIDLTFKEFELLKFFITHPRRVFTRPELLETVWESDYYGGTRTVDVHIRRLRAKIGTKVGNMINTVRNVGYRFG